MKAKNALALLAALSCTTAAAQDPQVAVPPHSASCTDSEATVLISRDDRLRGSAVHSRILIDGQQIGEVRRGENLSYCLKEGEHIIGVASDFFGGMGAQKRELAVDFKSGKSYEFRVFILHAIGAMIERTAH